MTANTVTNYIFGFGKHLAKVSGELNDPTEIITYHTDHIGSVRAVSDNNGDLLWEGEYSAFGELLFENSIANIKTPQIYGGKHYEKELELYYLNARCYDPSTVKFGSQDPIQDGSN